MASRGDPGSPASAERYARCFMGDSRLGVDGRYMGCDLALARVTKRCCSSAMRASGLGRDKAKPMAPSMTAAPSTNGASGKKGMPWRPPRWSNDLYTSEKRSGPPPPASCLIPSVVSPRPKQRTCEVFGICKGKATCVRGEWWRGGRTQGALYGSLL